jgi:hypothetical protein
MAIGPRVRTALAEVNLRAAVEQDGKLRRLRDRLAVLPHEGGKLGEKRATAVVERLIGGALDEVVGIQLGRFGKTMAKIDQLRAELHGRYQRAIDLFAKSKESPLNLPAELQPANLAALFDQLDAAMADLSAKMSKRGLAAEVELLGGKDTIERLMDPPVAEHGPVKPDLKLDDPEQLSLPPKAQQEPGSKDTAQGVTYREGQKFAPEDLTVRAEVATVAGEWANRVLGDELDRSFISRVPTNSDASIAALERLGPDDLNFAGRGYEIQLKLTGGPEFRPDGIRFLNKDGSRFQFLENKEMEIFRDDAGVHPERAQGIKDMIHRDAEIAQRLRSRGCAGFRYDTGHPALDQLIAKTIADLQKSKVPGSDLLTAPALPTGEH